VSRYNCEHLASRLGEMAEEASLLAGDIDAKSARRKVEAAVKAVHRAQFLLLGAAEKLPES